MKGIENRSHHKPPSKRGGQEILGLLCKRAIDLQCGTRSRHSALHGQHFALGSQKAGSFHKLCQSSKISDLRPNMWATSVPLPDAYTLHIPIHPKFQRFLASHYCGTDLFSALPFRLTTAPRVYTRVTRSVLAYLCSKGL